MLWPNMLRCVWLIGVDDTRLTLLDLTVGTSDVVSSMLGEQRTDIAASSC